MITVSDQKNQKRQQRASTYKKQNFGQIDSEKYAHFKKIIVMSFYKQNVY